MVSFKHFTKQKPTPLNYTDRAIVIYDTFDPIHKGHVHNIKLAEQLARNYDAKVVLAVQINASDLTSIETRLELLEQLYPNINTFGTKSFQDVLYMLNEKELEFKGVISIDASTHIETVKHTLGSYIAENATFKRNNSLHQFNGQYLDKKNIEDMLKTENVYRFTTLVPYNKKTAKRVFEEMRGNIK